MTLYGTSTLQRKFSRRALDTSSGILSQQSSCETSTDKRLSGDSSDVTEESSREPSATPLRQKRFNLPRDLTDEMSEVLEKLYFREKKVAKPTGRRVDPEKLVAELYEKFPEDMEKLRELERRPSAN